MPFQITSAAFNDQKPIPQVHSCDGDDSSPELRWVGTPNGTQSLALVVSDPDAPGGTFYHWLLYDLPPTLTEIPSGHYHDGSFPLGGLEGTNGFGKLGYGGPCPPPGAPHHYHFTLYALNQASLSLPQGAEATVVTRALQGKVLAQAELTGTYGR